MFKLIKTYEARKIPRYARNEENYAYDEPDHAQGKTQQGDQIKVSCYAVYP